MSYFIRNGKIQNVTCEINISLHCNLSCRACAHLSPVSPYYNMEPEILSRDLDLLAKYYHVEHIRFIGGEPLLHPGILELIDITLKSGITEKVRVVTNGVLLWKMPEDFWKKVQEVHVTAYPGKEMSPEQLEEYYLKSQKYNVTLRVDFIDHFRESFSTSGNKDNPLIQDIYNTCTIFHFLRSHTLHEGYLYKCPQSFFLPMFLKNEDLACVNIDGIKLKDSPDFGEELLAYLESPDVLKSCKYCLACAGREIPAEQIKRKDWWKPQKKPPEEMINIKDLSMLKWLNELWSHNRSVMKNLPAEYNQEKLECTVFAQLFSFGWQKISMLQILITIENIFHIKFTIFAELYVWYKV